MAGFEVFVGKGKILPVDALNDALEYVEVFCKEHRDRFIADFSHDIVRLGNDMFVATVVVLFTDYQR